MDQIRRPAHAAPTAQDVPDVSGPVAAGPALPPAVEVQGVAWGPRGQAEILTDIGFAVPQGQIVAICGANGAGKSSLLRLLYRHQAPSGGVVRLMGRDLWQMTAPEAARTLAAVLQEQASDFALSVRQIVALGRLPHRRGWGAGLSAPGRDEAAIIGDALARMDLGALADRAFGTLSGRAAAHDGGARPGATAARHRAGRADQPPGHPPPAGTAGAVARAGPDRDRHAA
ncbi:MAG: ABC transporter ATP-binding protein [Paracoccaceae bacterium]